MDLEELVGAIRAQSLELGRPIVVGISGYAGSGKSTLARRLVEQIPRSIRMRGDDFLKPTRSHQRSTDWDGVDRTRLVNDVLLPFRENRPSTFRRWDWGLGAPGAPEQVPTGDVMIVDLIGLFHPDALGALDITIWCDLDLATALERGVQRDTELGRHHSQLWEQVWSPNDRDFAEHFAPREAADIRFPTSAR